MCANCRRPDGCVARQSLIPREVTRDGLCYVMPLAAQPVDHCHFDIFVGQQVHPVAASWKIVNSEDSDAAA